MSLLATILTVMVLSGCLNQGGVQFVEEEEWSPPPLTSGSIEGGFFQVLMVQYERQDPTPFHVEFSLEIPEKPSGLTHWLTMRQMHRCDAEPARGGGQAGAPKDGMTFPVYARAGDVETSESVRPPGATELEDAYQHYPTSYGWETIVMESTDSWEGAGPLVDHKVFVLGAEDAPGMKWRLEWSNTRVEVQVLDSGAFAYDIGDFRGDPQVQLGSFGHGQGLVLETEIGGEDEWAWMFMSPRSIGAALASQDGTLSYERPDGQRETVTRAKFLPGQPTGMWRFEMDQTTETTERWPIVYGGVAPRVPLCDSLIEPDEGMPNTS